MWEGYIHAINEYIERYELEAHLVVDRFHVAKNYRDGFDDLRKKEMRRLKSEFLRKYTRPIFKARSGCCVTTTKS